MSIQVVTQQCGQCGGDFAVPAPYLKQGRGKYCSGRCYHLATRIPADVRFWRYVNKHGPVPPHCPAIGPCWLWVGALTGGYGVFWQDGRAEAHRFSWQLNVGPIPDGLYVLHRCDVRACVNPGHLFLGTAAANSRDMVEKGRQGTPRGERNGSRTHPERVPRGERHYAWKGGRERQPSRWRKESG